MKKLLLTSCLFVWLVPSLFSQNSSLPENGSSNYSNYIFYGIESNRINYSDNQCPDESKLPKEEADYMVVSPNGKNVWKISSNNVFKYSEDTKSWLLTPQSNNINIITAADDGTTWGLNDQNIVFKYDGSQWVIPNSNARLVSISAGSSVEVWGTDKYNNVYKYASGNWTIPNNTARLQSIYVGPDGSKWGIGVNYHVYKYVNNNWTMPNSDARLNNIFVLGENKVWGVSGEGNKTLYFYSNNNWNPVVLNLTFFPKAISNYNSTIPPKPVPLSANNFLSDGKWNSNSQFKIITLWYDSISVYKTYNGGIFRWNGKEWIDLKTTFRAAELYTNVKGDVLWARNTFDSVYQFKDSNWVRISTPNGLQKIAITKGNKVWGIDMDGLVYFYDLGDFKLVKNAPYKALNIFTFDDDGSIYITDIGSNVYKKEGDNFVRKFENMKLDVLIGSAFVRYGYNQDGHLYILHYPVMKNDPYTWEDITPNLGLSQFDYFNSGNSSNCYFIKNGIVYYLNYLSDNKSTWVDFFASKKYIYENCKWEVTMEAPSVETKIKVEADKKALEKRRMEEDKRLWDLTH